MFDTFSSDPQEAYYIFRPQYMAPTKDFYKRTSGKMRVVFDDNCIWIAYENKTKTTRPKLLNSISNDILNQYINDIK